jgi:hypothetical protein
VAIRLLLGVFPLLIVAGVIEGFVSPTLIDPAVKFAIGAALFVLLLLYVGGTARSHSRLPVTNL